MDESARKYAENTRGKPFEPGNPGRPKGARNRATRAAEELLDGEIEGLTRKCIDRAQEGDMQAMRLVLDRAFPVRKGRPVQIDLPAMADAEGVSEGFGAVLQAVSQGDLTTDEAKDISSILEARRKAIETQDLDARISALESKT